jgi:hypothetical protein
MAKEKAMSVWQVISACAASLSAIAAVVACAYGIVNYSKLRSIETRISLQYYSGGAGGEGGLGGGGGGGGAGSGGAGGPGGAANFN